MRRIHGNKNLAVLNRGPRTNRLMRVGVLALLIVIVPVGLVAPISGQQLRKVTFLLGTVAPDPANPQVHIAQALDYFREEGLSVTVALSAGGVNALKFLVLGRGDFALSATGTLVRSVQDGNPLKSVCTIIYGYSYDLVVLAASPVKNVKDLKGKKIGVSGPGSSAIPYMNVVFMELGLSASDVQLVSVGTQMLAFLALTRKEVDALAVSDSTSTLFDIEGVRVRRLEIALAKRLEGGMIAARSETIANDPEVVGGVLRALAKAQHYYFSNPRAGIIAMSKVVPDVAKDLERSIKQGAVRRTKSALPGEAGGLYCWTSTRRWEAIQDVMLAAGLVTRKLEPSTYFTTQFLLEANKFDRVKIRQEAQRVK